MLDVLLAYRSTFSIHHNINMQHYVKYFKNVNVYAIPAYTCNILNFPGVICKL